MARILVVDDDRGVREFLEIMLTREGYAVESTGDPLQVLPWCKKRPFDVVLTDLRMPKMDGIALLRQVKEIAPETQVILVTAFASGETALSAMKEGAFDYLEKNFQIDDLKRIVRAALDQKGLRQADVRFLKDAEESVGFAGMIGKSREMLRVYGIVKKAAETPVNVLIRGESGTGKELVAKAIHDHSPRKGMPFVVINCGGISETLLETELFGYVKGAFTGAYDDKTGLLRSARGGTVFFDEIAELAPALQVKLLRLVQEKSFRPVGGVKDVKVDVRILSATNQDLEAKVKDGGFREDLYYRLNVVSVHIPPLRERKEDIPILVRHFIDKYAEEFSKDVKTISRYALELLINYPFPGNVRELENIIERSIALESSNIILPENLFLREEAALPAAGDAALPEDGIDLNAALNRLEKRLVEQALARANGGKGRAAELLRITPDSLRYRIEKLGVAADG